LQRLCGNWQVDIEKPRRLLGWTPPLSLDEGSRRVCIKLLAGFDAKSTADMMTGVNMNRITLEPGKRGGRPCIRGLRITVYDVLSMLSTNMTQQEILEDFPELEPEDILAALAFAADREHKVYSLAVQ
jgi:uncharacterized protein (DUF433 family)